MKVLFKKLKVWATEKEKYLQTKEDIQSVGAANLHLMILDTFLEEYKTVLDSSVVGMKQLGEELQREKYEKGDILRDRESQVDQWFVTLDAAAKDKRLVLSDDLAREQFRESVGLMNIQHLDKHRMLMIYVAEKESYLQERENISSLTDAQTALSLLDVFHNENAAMVANNLVTHKKLAEEILSKQYSHLTQWQWDKPQEIKGRIVAVAKKFTQLKQMSLDKREYLQEAHTLEQEKEALRLQFANKSRFFVALSLT